MGQVWKIKALKDYNKIVKGMEIEVIKQNTTSPPSDSEIAAAFEKKYNIVAPRGVYGNKGSFEISKN